MTPSLEDKIKKVYALVTQGETEGEREAARRALDRIMKQYNLDDADIDPLKQQARLLTYTSDKEMVLLIFIVWMFVGEDVTIYRLRIGRAKRSKVLLNYEDWITVEASFEYFKRHMAMQWRKVQPQYRKFKKKKSKKHFEDLFVEQYIIRSKLVKEEKVKNKQVNSRKERRHVAALDEVEGGKYNKQVVGGLMLNETNP